MVLGPDQSGKPCDSQKGSFGSYTSHPDDDDDDDYVDNDDDNVDQRNNYQHLISSKASQNQKLRDISSHFFLFWGLKMLVIFWNVELFISNIANL